MPAAHARQLAVLVTGVVAGNSGGQVVNKLGQRWRVRHADGLAARVSADGFVDVSAHQAQGVVGIKLRADQLGGDDFLGIQTLKQAPHDGRFSSAHFTGNDDKAFVLVHAVFKIGLGAAVLLAPEIEVGVRVELERLAGQAVIGFVHTLENDRDASDEGVLGVGIR